MKKYIILKNITKHEDCNDIIMVTVEEKAKIINQEHFKLGKACHGSVWTLNFSTANLKV